MACNHRIIWLLRSYFGADGEYALDTFRSVNGFNVPTATPQFRRALVIMRERPILISDAARPMMPLLGRRAAPPNARVCG